MRIDFFFQNPERTLLCPIGLPSLVLSPKKCVFMVRQGKKLGLVVSKNGISTDKKKIQVIVNMPRLRNSKEVQAFMGHCGYYCNFMFQYVSIAQPLLRIDSGLRPNS